MRSRERDTTEPAQMLQRDASSLSSKKRTTAEDAALDRVRTLKGDDAERVEELMKRSVPVEADENAVLAQWRSWESKVERDFQTPGPGEVKAYDDYRLMFALAHERAIERTNVDDARTTDVSRSRLADVTEPNHGIQPLQTRDHEEREQLPVEAQSRDLLRLEERARWSLAMHYDRGSLRLEDEDPRLAANTERHLQKLNQRDDLKTVAQSQALLERLDQKTREGPERERAAAFAAAVVVGQLVRDRLSQERAREAVVRRSGREKIRGLDAKSRNVIDARITNALKRPEFQDSNYCRLEGRRLARLPERNRAERERLLVLSATSEARTQDFHAANWDREVRLGFPMARDSDRAKEMLANLRRRDDELKVEARAHVAEGRDDAAQWDVFHRTQASYCVLEHSHERERLMEAADEKAAFIKYIEIEQAEQKAALETSPMRQVES